MRRDKATIIWGVGLLLVGILLLLQNLGVLRDPIGLVWMGVFGVGGLAFISVYLSNRAHWWALIPGGTLLGLAALMGLDFFAPRIGSILGAPLFLGFMGLGFLVVFIAHRENWWAMIPGGVLLTVALVALLDGLNPGFDAGAVMMLGLAATFGLLSLVETPQGRMRWPLIPAGVLLVIGLIILIEAVAWSALIIALLLIAVGGYLVIRSLSQAREW